MECNFHRKILLAEPERQYAYLTGKCPPADRCRDDYKKNFPKSSERCVHAAFFLKKIFTDDQHVRGMYRKSSGLETIF
jgi:hypothetical protein